MKLLTQNEFKATMGLKKMIAVDIKDFAAIDAITYLKSIPANELLGHKFLIWDIEKVYSNNDHSYFHLLFPSSDQNVYLILIVEADKKTIRGHCLLNLNEHYGL